VTRPKPYFVLGRQLVGVQVVAPMSRAAVAKLLAGPPAHTGLQTLVPQAARVQCASRPGSTATIGLRGVRGRHARSADGEARPARLHVASVRGVRLVLVLVDGQTRPPRPVRSST